MIVNTPEGSSANGTATTKGARDHARAQANQRVDGMPSVPPATYQSPPGSSRSGAVPTDILTWAETVPGGRYTTKVLARGTRLALTDITGTACASVMLWRRDAPWERVSVADTVKVPWQAYLSSGHPLLSDQGRVLATIVADTSAHHDALCGGTTLAQNVAKYGAGQAHSSSPATRELLVLAAAKNGLTPTDVAPTVSFFHGVKVTDRGDLISTGSAGPGAGIELLLHLDCIVAVANSAHPLDPAPEFDTGMLEVLAWPAVDDLAALVDATDVAPEYRRSVLNSEDAFAAQTTSQGAP